ncbi:hypothetical protein [Methylobacter sp.]|uniref:hypothetical protein n=1 Tax=Methylobacter sp. TaxID=2051955 RepID=UPI0024871C76|nr:hypothetical protein [Methylobacter sp.]MDI1276784.1 hypothetical protein [Methylobacter sp.]MDI1357452.1 hypothetical protein [Methylobacter sp.]
MRKIAKGTEPVELTVWKTQNQHGYYKDLTHVERQAINQATRKEQLGLCAYCCKKIDENNSMNEHVEARQLAPNRQLDFGNIVASCTTRGRCDSAHKSQPLLLTPLMAECETELKFYMSGKVAGLSQQATDSISVLGLDSRAIREERKQMLDNLIFPDIADDMQLLGNDLLADWINDLQQTDDDDKLLPYSPVLVNIISGLLVM